MTTQLAHAKTRPPSAAHRWLSCAASVTVMPLYPNTESEAALKGTRDHNALEVGILFGIAPDTGDIDSDYAVMGALEWVAETKASYGKDCKVYAEKRYDIPQTGEFGTCDVTFVTPSALHIADYKGGYVPVDVEMNPQLMIYLLGAIAEFGERKHYKVSVLQPGYLHRDGPWRTWEVSQADLEWLEGEIKYSMANEHEFKAGKHCKKTYCLHRASCVEFHTYARTEAHKAWWPSDVHALDDVQLAQALDHADVIHGIRDELRKEAIRRMMQQDRKIPGYKMVKSREQRSFKDEAAREAAFNLCRELGATDEQLYEKKPESVAGIERFIKAKFKSFGQGKWATVWEQNFKDHLRDFSSSLTLEKAIDGRPAHTRGAEFGSLMQPQPQVDEVKQVSII